MDDRLWGIIKDSFLKMLIPGLQVTLPLTFLSCFFAFIIATVVAIIQYADIKGLKQICRFYIWIIRGTPLLVQLYLVFYGLPVIGITLEAFPAAVLCFSINEGAYLAENMRAALESVPKGQLEAGSCVGMSYWQVMIRIILPQALRTAFPSIGNSVIAMVKSTSMASVITVSEMLRAAQKINAIYYEPLAIYIEVALIYLMMCTVLTWIQSFIEKRLNAYGGQR